MRIELKPCPFCGNEYPSIGGSDDVEGEPFYYVVCYSCLAVAHGEETKEKAIANWNRRADHVDPSER